MTTAASVRHETAGHIGIGEHHLYREVNTDQRGKLEQRGMYKVSNENSSSLKQSMLSSNLTPEWMLLLLDYLYWGNMSWLRSTITMNNEAIVQYVLNKYLSVCVHCSYAGLYVSMLKYYKQTVQSDLAVSSTCHIHLRASSHCA